jgi:broad specificity phosphatase PhoE
MNMPLLPIVALVRHGETAWTISGQHTGRSDISLTPQGEEEARRLNEHLRNLHFTEVFTSPLERARRTCQLSGFGAAAQEDADLLEWDYGEYEGRRTSEIRAERPAWRLFEDGCPGGETARDVGLRADRIIAKIRASRGNVLLFAHRDVLRVLTARWLGLEARDGRFFWLATASVSILGYDHDVTEPVVRVWNDVPP